MSLISRIQALKIPDDKMVRAITVEVYSQWRRRNEVIDMVLAMPEIQALSIAIDDEKLDKLKVIYETSGMLKTLTPDELKTFEEAIKRYE